MKPFMIGIISAVVGSGSAIAVHSVNTLIAHHGEQEQHLRSLMYEQPLEQGPGDMARAVPDGVLPLDATPTPGATPEPGSARPSIQLKPGIKLPWQNSRPSAKLILTRSKEIVKNTKDPIWNLQLVSDGKVLDTLPALSGRSFKQLADRNIAGNKSPLPVGNYSIDRYGIARAPFSDPELGKGYWVPITPLFNTQRSALGFHQDPSWGRTNGESGTSGCIGLESPDATAKLVDWIKHYNIQLLTVES
ncbi:MAG: hypothetical protein EHM17_16350 [Verrucomicrobiaceae bacterium]|nr:MAG: hypothetical protein EHM17_16350 [Verrucomicrobiaceae bacterium]